MERHGRPEPGWSRYGRGSWQGWFQLARLWVDAWMDIPLTRGLRTWRTYQNHGKMGCWQSKGPLVSGQKASLDWIPVALNFRGKPLLIWMGHVVREVGDCVGLWTSCGHAVTFYCVCLRVKSRTWRWWTRTGCSELASWMSWRCRSWSFHTRRGSSIWSCCCRLAPRTTWRPWKR